MPLVSLLLAAALWIASPLCASTPTLTADEDWGRVLPGLELAYPADHGAHPSTRTEWWYLTGQLEAADGARFGFQFTVFRRGLAAGPAAEGSSPLRARQVLAGHLALTDIDGQRTLFAERLRRAGSPLARAATGDLDVVLEDWSLQRQEDPGRPESERLLLSASDPTTGIALELELVPTKPLVRHGVDGYSAKGADPGNASAYVSWPRLLTRGRIEIDGEPREVTGQAWFDHEFGTSVLEPDVLGWVWFGLQLDDGRELMLFHLRRSDGTLTPASAGTLVEADGRTRALGLDEFSVEVLASWTSPHSAATYPARWRLEVPSAGLELVVAPLVPDCELHATGSVDVSYWEGPVEITGSSTGRGYAELTGFAGSMAGRF